MRIIALTKAFLKVSFKWLLQGLFEMFKLIIKLMLVLALTVLTIGIFIVVNEYLYTKDLIDELIKGLDYIALLLLIAACIIVLRNYVLPLIFRYKEAIRKEYQKQLE